MEKRPQISMRTVPNGYVFNYNGNEFMYFNEVDLLAGFISHVGSGDTHDMDKPTILNTIFSVMLGEKYARDVNRLQKTVDDLQKRYAERITKLEKAIAIVDDANKKHETLKENIKETTERSIKMRDAYAHAMEPYEEYNRRIMNLEAKTMKMEAKYKSYATQAESLLTMIKNTLEHVNADERILSSRIQQNMYKIDRIKTTADNTADEGGDQPGKSEPEEEQKKPGPKPKAKPIKHSINIQRTATKGGRNKTADAKVLEELERQAQEHFENQK